ncbi:MAG: hypothetical protein H0U67_01755 [Gemmatimonadetes bacterium]|nr:hypothetical protein [Gemmatimonadota bacterium]MBA4159170.1 hypothetical protein [Gemmatimonadota bacterium]
MPKRTRGRSYPALSLREAVERTRQFYDVERSARVSPEDAVQTWGYRSLNGASQRVLSAVRQYGLLEDVQGDVKISPRALTILLDEEHTDDYQQALKAAAREPAVFAEILDEHEDGLPSDTALVSYLVRKREFTEDAARKINAALRDTLEYVRERTRDLARENPGAHLGGSGEEPEAPPPSGSSVKVDPLPPPRAPGQVTMKYEFALSEHTTAMLVVSGEVSSEDLDVLDIMLSGARKALARSVREREAAEGAKRDGSSGSGAAEPGE